jgi:hypothetical protein
MDYIILYPRGDRLGSHILQYISILIYAVYNNLYIVYDKSNLKFTENIFVLAILNYINKYNSRFPKNNYKEKIKDLHIQEYWLDFEKTYDHFNFFYTYDIQLIMLQVVRSINSDIISYTNKYIGDSLRLNLKNVIPSNYVIPFDPKKTILIHLRLDDVRDKKDYNGSICSNFYKNKIDNTNNIFGIINLGYCNQQAPLSKDKINIVLEEALNKYPEHEIVIVTSPGDYETGFPYRTIRSEDESYDLFLLCNSEVLILSRSCFAFNSLFFGIAKDVWCPLWGHFVSSGLNTKYDNSLLNYFY